MENQDNKQQLVEVPKKYVFYHVSGQVTYLNKPAEAGKVPKFKREIVTTLYRGNDVGIPGRAYGGIHSALIMQFQKEYAPIFEVTKVEPNILKCDIITIFPMGEFTQAEFEAGIDLTNLNPDPDKES